MPAMALSSAVPVTNRGGAQPTRLTTALGWIAFSTAVGSTLAALTLTAVNRPSVGTAIGSVGVASSVAVSFATAGLIVQVRRPNLVGAMLLAEGVLAGLNVVAQQYAWLALITWAHTLPLGEPAAWLSLWTFVPMVALIAAGLPLVFPRWRPGRVERGGAVAAGTGTMLLSLLIAFSPASDFSLPGIVNPFAIPEVSAILGPLGGVGLVLLFAGAAFAVGSLVRHYRKAPTLERLQLKWFAYGAALAALALAAPMLLYVLGHPLPPAVFGAIQVVTLPLLPITIALAIARRRLYDIDRLISRSLVYGLLTAGIAATYLIVAAAVGLIAGPRSAWPAVAGVACAIAALELGRGRLQRSVERLLYGERRQPHEALARLSRRLEDSDSNLEVVVTEVARSLRLPTAALWLVDGRALRVGAAHHGTPADVQDPRAVEALAAVHEPLATSGLPAGPLVEQLEKLGAEIVLPLRQSGQLVGVLGLAPREPGDAFNAADFDLLGGLASQAAGAALAAQLGAGLQTARERLVLAQDEERRRIQRDLHDELGPTLASVRMRLSAILAEEPRSDIRSELQDLDQVVADAAGGVRRLVHDLRPLALEQVGLKRALAQWVDRFGADTHTVVELDLPAGLELAPAAQVALYRIVQEALHNAHRHGHASRVCISLMRERTAMTLVIEDDGSGMTAQVGSGVSGMRERIEELGGSFAIGPRVGLPGTRIVCWLPLRRAGDG